MSRNVHWRPHHSSNSNNSTATAATTLSARSCETAPTEYSYRPRLAQYDTCHGRLQGRAVDDYQVQPARSSVDTYASTSEEEDLADDFDHLPEYQIPQYQLDPMPVDAIPTTPRDFADLFPTSKRLSIRHDDSTIDGNMNLRVDTQIEERQHRKQNYTLFHLRMHDLRSREFSLRRYCRDSGREVCHSRRKYQKPPPEKRPALQRASTALASLIYKPDSRPSAAATGLKRSDSGYASIPSAADMDMDQSENPNHSPSKLPGAKGRPLMPTNTIKLEFSNYAHIDVKRRGASSNKRYGFEYWGHDYSWKRVVLKDQDHEVINYYLFRADLEKYPLAHISPVRLSQEQDAEEKARGGWIPPCYMRITDESLLNPSTDVSDVVVATGLMALVDDCIKRKFHSKPSATIHIPLLRNASFKMEYVGPKRLIDEVFHRTGRSGAAT